MYYKMILETSGEHVATPSVVEPIKVGERIQLQLDGEEAVYLVTKVEHGVDQVGETIVIGTVSVDRVI